MRGAFLIIFLGCFIKGLSQPADTTIYAQGKILNATTKEAVVAKVSFQSLPYGNKVGFRAGSEYSFPLFDNDRYEITVEADGFETYKTILDPASASTSRRVVKDIELTKSAKEEAPLTGKVIPLDNVTFDQEQANIKPSSHKELNDIAKMLLESPNMIIQIEGHTGDRGSKSGAYVMRLSKDRVQAVKEYLVSKGVSGSRIKTKAFGDTKPFYTGNDAKKRALNRRVEARIIQN
jgi:OOP family OmpA-OmpF porin